jgi:hypothetical protein
MDKKAKSMASSACLSSATVMKRPPQTQHAQQPRASVRFPLPVYHRLGSRQGKKFTKRLMRMKSVSHLASHYHHLAAPALKKLIFAGGRN